MLQDNLKKTAVALEYEKGDMAPKVIASMSMIWKRYRAN